jgi:hypothetical protein
MSDDEKNALYDKVFHISKTYLGPAAERFIYRQVKNHLDKEPEQLKQADMTVLIDWIRISVSFLTEDSNVIEEYVHQLNQLVTDSGEHNGG